MKAIVLGLILVGAVSCSKQDQVAKRRNNLTQDSKKSSDKGSSVSVEDFQEQTQIQELESEFVGKDQAGNPYNDTDACRNGFKEVNGELVDCDLDDAKREYSYENECYGRDCEYYEDKQIKEEQKEAERAEKLARKEAKAQEQAIINQENLQAKQVKEAEKLARKEARKEKRANRKAKRQEKREAKRAASDVKAQEQAILQRQASERKEALKQEKVLAEQSKKQTEILKKEAKVSQKQVRVDQEAKFRQERMNKVEQLKKKKAAKVAQEAKTAKVTQEAKTAKVTQEAKTAKVTQEAKTAKVTQEAKTAKVAQEAKTAKVTQEAKTTKVAQEAKTAKVTQGAKTTKVAQKTKSVEFDQEARNNQDSTLIDQYTPAQSTIEQDDREISVSADNENVFMGDNENTEDDIASDLIEDSSNDVMKGCYLANPYNQGDRVYNGGLISNTSFKNATLKLITADNVEMINGVDIELSNAREEGHELGGALRAKFSKEESPLSLLGLVKGSTYLKIQETDTKMTWGGISSQELVDGDLDIAQSKSYKRDSDNVYELKLAYNQSEILGLSLDLLDESGHLLGRVCVDSL